MICFLCMKSIVPDCPRPGTASLGLLRSRVVILYQIRLMTCLKVLISVFVFLLDLCVLKVSQGMCISIL